DDIHARTMLYQWTPLAAVRRGERRLRDAVVDRIAFVGEDVEFIAAVQDAVAHPGLARRHHARHGIGQREVDQPALGGLVIAGGDDAEAAARAFLRAREPAGVLLLIDEDVVALRGAQPVAPDL